MDILDKMEMLNLIIGLLLDLGKFLFKRFKKPDPVQVLKHREKFKKEFEQNLRQRDKYGTRGDAIIRDIKRMDSYPDIDARMKGISPWFRVEVKGLYHKGVEVFISMPRYIKKDKNDAWTFTEYNDQDEKLLVYPVGRIPFDVIKYIDWEGDGYYRFPHIYCEFKEFKGQPYESIPFFEKREGTDYLFEVQGFTPWNKKEGRWLIKLRKS